MAPLSLQSKHIPQLLLGRHYVFTSQLLRLFQVESVKVLNIGRIPSKIHRFEATNRWKLVFFFGSRFQHLWPGKLWKGTGGWNGENQDLVWNLELWVSMISISSEWFSVVTFAIFPLISPFFLTGNLHAPKASVRSSTGATGTQKARWWWNASCYFETLPPWSNIISFLWVVCRDQSCNGILFWWKIYMCFTDSFPLLVAYTNDRSWKNCTIRSLPPWISWWVLSAWELRETKKAWESQRVTRWRHPLKALMGPTLQ